MGVEYYVVDKDKRTFYDLGKGGWYALNDDKEAFQDQEYLALYLLTECCGLDSDDKEWAWWKQYIETRVAPDLFAAFGDSKKDSLFVFNDCGDDITICRAKGYRCIGTRYGEGVERQERIDFENRHFDGNGKLLGRYEPEGYKQYPEWAIY